MMKPSNYNSEEAGSCNDDKPKPSTSVIIIKGVSLLDLVLRVVALIATFASAVAMASTSQTLPFFTQLLRFRARYTDLPTFKFFVFTNSLVTAYFILILPLSYFHVTAIAARSSRVIVLIFDTVMLAFLGSGTAATAAIIYVARNGSARANWYSVCQLFGSYCDRISGALIGSVVAVAVLLLLILFSALAISR
ncbi:hypothetical protein V2J09_024159 [Rumex salicifolius]